MKLGQTSAIHFGSRITTSVLGFVATVYLANELGSEVLGMYFLLLAVLSWATNLGDMGVRIALTKYLGERERQASYFSAGLLVRTVAFVVVSLALWLGAPYLDRYLGFAGADFLLVLFLVSFFLAFVRTVLRGQHQVHVAALLQPLDRGLRTVLQVGAVFLGFGLSSLFVSYAVAGAVALVVGASFVSVSLVRPAMAEVRALLSFVKYAWVENFSSRSLNKMDTLVLGFFVGVGQIGVYEVAWNVATVVAVFQVSISQTLFPEMSSVAAGDDEEALANLLNDALAFTGLFVIPGLVGGALLAEPILGIYGGDFRRGAQVFVVLILARMVYSYAAQFTTTLNALDRPDVSFRVNSAFVASNLVLNVVLVWQVGWLGAAVATALSAGVALVLGYRSVSRLLPLRLPWTEVGKQVAAAGVMGVGVLAGTQMAAESTATTVALVGGGAVIYGLVLFAISRRFRTTVLDNVPAVA